MSRDESRRSKRCRADRDFDLSPGTNIMVNDYDDERTLDEEEALEGSEDTHNELSHLQKESDMPLQDLLVMYYGDRSCQDPNKAEDEDDDEEEDEDEEEDDEDEDDDDPASLKQFYSEMVKADENGANVKRPSTAKTADTTRSGDAAVLVPSVNTSMTASMDSKVESSSDATGLTNSGDAQAAAMDTSNVGVENANSASGIPSSSGGGGGGSSRLLRSVSRPQSEEEEDDCDYSPDEEEWKKTIMVGSEYQAAIPEGLCRYDDALPYENEDKMLWDPSHISEDKVEEFLERAQLPVVKGSSLPSGSHVRDDEQALYLLLQCGYNLEEALRRRRMNVLPSTESVSLWSEEECHNFETGLRNYGKDFHLIQKNKVRTRSVGELVQFYYLWKKTERHDIFTYKARLEKKKYALHPGITDYMDRFLEEQEGVRDRSSSPNVHCLIYGDAKRQRTNANVTNNEEQQQNQQSSSNRSALDSWENTNNATVATTTSTTSSSGTGGCNTAGGGADNSASVNSTPSDPLAVEHHHNSLSSPVTIGQVDYSKASCSVGLEPSSAAMQSWSSSTTTTTSTTPSSSSSSSLQQLPQRNHLHHHQATSGSNINSAGNSVSNTENAAVTIAPARSFDNIIPHLPP